MFRKKHFYGTASKTKTKPNSKILPAVFLVIIIVVGTELAQAIRREYEINKEIDSLKEEITRYDKENNDLEKMMEYYNTLSYKEKEARLKLNLQKPGEKTILVDPSNEEAAKSEIKMEIKKEAENSLKGETNIKKWWNYFFEKR